MKRLPLDEVAEFAQAQMDMGRQIFQQFVCAHCGMLQQMPEPNTIWDTAICEECGDTTDLRVVGCNVAVSVRRNIG